MRTLQNKVNLAELQDMAAQTDRLLDSLRTHMLTPDSAKKAPLISGERVATMCGLTKGQFAYRVKNGAPSGQVSTRGGRRELTVAEAREWSQQTRKKHLRPEGALAKTLAVCFFKGGVSKTTTCQILAQSFSLLGHKVLIVDMDPQGSLTTLQGLLPNQDVAEDQTLVPLFNGDAQDVRYAIRDTYWPGVSLIPAGSTLFQAEFMLPSRQMQDRSFQFWDVLNKGLAPIKDEFDIIIIDTPPALSYMNINAFYAADGLVVPTTTSMLDLASSSQFWKLFSDFAAHIQQASNTTKEYDFINILLTKVNNQDTSTKPVREWLQMVYGPKVMPIEIPQTAVTSGAMEFSTPMDITKYEGDTRTYRRARDAYDTLALKMEENICTAWARDLAAQGSQA